MKNILLRQFQILLVQAVFILDITGVFRNTVDRTHFYALRHIMMAYAFGTHGGIDDVDVFALGNGAVRALGLADIAIDTFITNKKGHTYS
jgi:hypothetical protein